jgi:uncharacterized membrane protein YgaE (UPF0421/DUF939 family)
MAPALQLSVRAAAAAGLSVALASSLALPFPIYALVSAVIVTDLVPARSRQLALPRVGGTAIGAVLGAMLTPVLPAGSIAITVGVFAAMAMSYVLRLADAAKLAGYTCAIVLLDYRAEGWSYAALRFTETVLGIAVAVGVSLVPKLIRIEEESPTPSKDRGQP